MRKDWNERAAGGWAGVLLGIIAACAAPEEPVAPPPQAPSVTPRVGLMVRGSARLEEGEWLLPTQGTTAALMIEGQSGVVLDLSGVTLRGAPLGADLDGLDGVGILVRNCQDVVLKGGFLGGYKACVVVEDSTGVVLEDLSFDGWYGMRLGSTTASEDPADWLWPHENDAGQWQTTYGAAISITGCEAPVVRRCRGRHGQNGLLLSRVVGAQVYDNDFSFLSGWGLGMWRAVGNTVSRNVFDYCVRGYSHDVYWRGQDSAGILMFESCTDNVIAFNSATHGGDGVFLYAGHDLTEGRARQRGETAIGSDRNVFWGNDLRFAVANALEATFSDQLVVAQNLLSGSHQHGLWGGYCSRMVVWDNEINDTQGGGISIEHGQECVLAENRLRGNDLGLELWWDEDPSLVDGPLGQQRDTASRDHWIGANAFSGNASDLLVRRTTGLVFAQNSFEHDSPSRVEFARCSGVDGNELLGALHGWVQSRQAQFPSGLLEDSTLRAWDLEQPALLLAVKDGGAPVVPGEQEFRAEVRGDFGGGLETIVMGEWGPWDFRSGEPRPDPVLPGGVLAGLAYEARWFSWAASNTDPRTDLEGWRELGQSAPVVRTITGLSDPFGGDPKLADEVGGSRFGLIARGQFESDAGLHRLRVTSDDGIRVIVDGEVAYEDWTWHAPLTETVDLELEAGSHELVVEYFQMDGAMALLLALEPAP